MKTMEQHTFLRRGMSIAVAMSIGIGTVLCQNLVISSSGSVSNTGTIKVKGNINTSGASGAVSIGGTVQLNGTSGTQQLGVSGSNALTFATLQAAGSVAKQMDVNVTVTNSLDVNITGALNLDLQANTLTLDGSSSLTTGSLDVSDPGSTVAYDNSSGSQTVLGLAYGGAVTLSGNATKDLSATASVAGTFSQSGGALTVNHNLTVSSAAPTFAAIADVTGNSTLDLSGTGAKSITTVTTVSSGSTISNSGASGLLTVATLSGNAGTISGGAGGITFTNAAANSGAITGGAGAVTFSNTLNTSGGTITAGAGTIAFNGNVTQTGGTITSANSTDILNFGANIDNSGGGTVSLTGTGAAEFAGTVTANGTGLSFASGTTVTYDGVTAGQAIADVDYGNLTLKNNTKSWTLGAARTVSNNLDVQASSAATIGGSFNLNVGGNVSLADNLTKSANAVVFASASSAVSSTGGEIVGNVERTHTFTGGVAYTFNRPEVTMALASTAAADITLGMQPGTDPTTGIGTKYAQRKYTLSSTTDVTTNNLTAQLYYLDSELQGTPNESRLALYKYSGGSWSKLGTNGGSYTRNTAGATNTIQLTAVNQGLSGISEIGIRILDFSTIASGAWNAIATWGTTASDIPTTVDDAVINNQVTGLGGANQTVASLTINTGGELDVDANTFNASTITSTGTISVASGATLAVSGAFQNNTGGAASVTVSGTATLSGAVTNAGTFTVNGASGLVNATAGLTNSGTIAVNNASGQLNVSGADFTNTGTLTNAGTVTVQ